MEVFNTVDEEEDINKASRGSYCCRDILRMWCLGAVTPLSMAVKHNIGKPLLQVVGPLPRTIHIFSEGAIAAIGVVRSTSWISYSRTKDTVSCSEQAAQPQYCCLILYWAKMRLLAIEEDIPVLYISLQVTEYFSYEHFYVVFCRFYELDADRDGRLSGEDLIKYGEHGLSRLIVDRYPPCFMKFPCVVGESAKPISQFVGVRFWVVVVEASYPCLFNSKDVSS